VINQRRCQGGEIESVADFTYYCQVVREQILSR